MDTSKLTGLRQLLGRAFVVPMLTKGAPCPGARRVRTQAAFSLVEVTLAIGIMAFAFTSIFGLLPLGLTVFRQAIDASVGSQIVQRVVNDAQQTDFSLLVADASGTALSSAGSKAVRYFDDQGSEIVPVTPGALTSQEKSRVIYWVNTRILPVTAITGNLNTNGKLATVTVQIANNPGNQTLARDSSTQLWIESSFPMTTYSALVSAK